MKQAIKYILLILAVLLFASIPLAMQLDTGSLTGKIADELGPVANATLEARNGITGVTHQTLSGTGGTYNFENLPAGRYSLWIRAQGHDSLWIREVVVERGRTTRRDIRLSSARTLPTD